MELFTSHSKAVLFKIWSLLKVSGQPQRATDLVNSCSSSPTPSMAKRQVPHTHGMMILGNGLLHKASPSQPRCSHRVDQHEHHSTQPNPALHSLWRNASRASRNRRPSNHDDHGPSI